MRHSRPAAPPSCMPPVGRARPRSKASRAASRCAAVVLLGPDGAPRRVLATLGADGAIRSRFRLDRTGVWKVQVLATLASGPEPVLEAVLLAGSGEAPEESAPDLTDADGAPLADV